MRDPCAKASKMTFKDEHCRAQNPSSEGVRRTFVLVGKGSEVHDAHEAGGSTPSTPTRKPQLRGSAAFGVRRTKWPERRARSLRAKVLPGLPALVAGRWLRGVPWRRIDQIRYTELS